MARRRRTSWSGGYTAPTSAAFGGTMSAGPQGQIAGPSTNVGLLAHPPPPFTGAPAAAPPAPAAAAPGSPDFAGDSGYIAALARLAYERDTGTAGINQQGAYDRTDTAEAIRRLNERQPQDTQVTKENANKQGLLLSGYLGKQLGDLQTQYARSRGDRQQSFDRRDAARRAAIADLAKRYEFGAGDARSAAIARLLAGDTAAADAGTLAPPTGAPVAPAAAAAAPAAVKPLPPHGSSSHTLVQPARRRRGATGRIGKSTFHSGRF